jgi:hypothetical protein
MILPKNQAPSALYLILAFVCSDGLFGLMNVPFIAAVKIIIYAGAIIVLFIFVIMMTDIPKGLSHPVHVCGSHAECRQPGIYCLCQISLFLERADHRIFNKPHHTKNMTIDMDKNNLFLHLFLSELIIVIFPIHSCDIFITSVF